MPALDFTDFRPTRHHPSGAVFCFRSEYAEELNLDKRDPDTSDTWQDFKEELDWLVLGIKTVCTFDAELEAQRWLVTSFLDCAFTLRRYEAANCCMKVFGLDHRRARDLYDLTMLEIRRATYDQVGHPKEIRPGDLVHTKARSLIPYARYFSEDDFTRLCILLRDLAPTLILRI